MSKGRIPPATPSRSRLLLALDRMIESVVEDMQKEAGNHATLGFLQGEKKGLMAARTYAELERGRDSDNGTESALSETRLTPREPGSGRAAALLALHKREQHYDIDEWVALVNELEDDCLRLHREKMDALFGPDGLPRAAVSAIAPSFTKIGFLHRVRDGQTYFNQTADVIPLGLHETLNVYMKDGDRGE